jgi:hypothetical protein
MFPAGILPKPKILVALACLALSPGLAGAPRERLESADQDPAWNC